MGSSSADFATLQGEASAEQAMKRLGSCMPVVVSCFQCVAVREYTPQASLCLSHYILRLTSKGMMPELRALPVTCPIPLHTPGAVTSP